MSVTIQLRGGTAAEWTSANPILAVREMGIETDSLLYKIGDGTTSWTSLPYRSLTGTFTTQTFDSFSATVEPSAPAAGHLSLYSKDVGGRMLPKVKGPSGLDSPLQTAIWGNGVVVVLPAATTALTTVGATAPTVVGTLSHPAITAGSLLLSTRRGQVLSAATAGSASELRIAAFQAWRGDASGLGGFFATFRFGCSTDVATTRFFVGFNSSTSATSVTQDPAALTNCIFIGNAAGQPNLRIMHNDAAGSCTQIDLGASFPVPTLSNSALYELVLFAPPNDTQVGYRVTRLDTGMAVSGSLTTDLPPASTFLVPHMYANNGGTAAAVGLIFLRYYLETDY